MLSVTGGSSGEYQVPISDNSEVTQAAGGGKFAKVSQLHGRESSFPGRRSELGVPKETSVPARALTPCPEIEFVSDHKMGIDYSSHH